MARSPCLPGERSDCDAATQLWLDLLPGNHGQAAAQDIG